MGNTITPTPGEKTQFNQDDLINRQNVQIESEETQNKLFEDIHRQSGIIELKTKIVIEYFNNLILDCYKKPLSHFREFYRFKKNYPVTEDMIYTIYVVENIYSKVLHNLKVFKIPFKNFFYEDLDIIGQDVYRMMLTNDLDMMQNFRNPNVDNLFAFYIDVKKDALHIMVISTFTSSYSLLDAMNDKIAKSQKFSDMEFQQILKFLLELLNKMRNMNIIHRGLTPGSIFFQNKNDYSSLIIRNFYFASNNFNGEAKGLTGSLWYSAPEILRDSDQDFKVDVYSVGVILYQVLTLKNLFQNLTKKEEILKKIEDGSIQKSLKHMVNLDYNKVYLEKINKMIQEIPSERYSIDVIISNPDIKNIRKRQTKHFLKDYSNNVFNLKINRNILDKFKEVLTNADKRIIGLVFHIFNSGKEYIMDQSMVKKTNILFDYLDVNNNNFVTTDEFRDRLIELLVDTEDEKKLNENKEIVKEYADKFREVLELIMDNEYNKMRNIDSKQFNLDNFLNASLIIWFFDEKERMRMIKSNAGALLIKNENAALPANLYQSQNNKINDEDRNLSTPNHINDGNISNKDDINQNLKKLNSNNASIQNQSKSIFKDKSMNDKRMNYGKDFSIYHPECMSIKNENKLTSFVNAFFNTKNLIAFDKLIFDKRKFDIRVFSQIEAYLIEKYMNKKEDNIFEICKEEMKYYMSKDNLVKFLEFQFI